MATLAKLDNSRYFLFTCQCKKDGEFTNKHIIMKNTARRIPSLPEIKKGLVEDIGDFEEMVIMFMYEFKDKLEHDQFCGIS